MLVANVFNTEGKNIDEPINTAAAVYELDPVHLLALLYAESGLNPHAERWGRETAEARDRIRMEDWTALQGIINRWWPDISFGCSQRIVRFHDLGDQSRSIWNVMAVRAGVFEDPAGDIMAAARRLKGAMQHPSYDGTALSAMVIYNAGADRRSDPVWMAKWAGNVATYEHALEWAEQYRINEEEPTMERQDNIPALLKRLEAPLHALWSIADEVDDSEYAVGFPAQAVAIRAAVVELKKALGLQPEDS